ncbi:unnamed protein product [Prorocentrum cordatum]|uniref:Uncharacterized protein n=1 Tax=Prorocentrum cordatum TaxID=2364126 RepID=A0ABN9VHI9_9DINO|nr:unnamed protein product [Polarella glacialis]
MPPQVWAVLPLAPMILMVLLAPIGAFGSSFFGAFGSSSFGANGSHEWSRWRPDAPDAVELELMSMPLFEKGTGAVVLAIPLALETSSDAAILSAGGHLARAPRPELAAMRAPVQAPVEDGDPGNLEQGSHHSLTESTAISLPRQPYRIGAGGRSESAGSSCALRPGEVSPVTQDSGFGTPPPAVCGFRADSRHGPAPSAPRCRADMNSAWEVADRLQTQGVMPSPDCFRKRLNALVSREEEEESFLGLPGGWPRVRARAPGSSSSREPGAGLVLSRPVRGHPAVGPGLMINITLAFSRVRCWREFLCGTDELGLGLDAHLLVRYVKPGGCGQRPLAILSRAEDRRVRPYIVQHAHVGGTLLCVSWYVLSAACW